MQPYLKNFLGYRRKLTSRMIIWIGMIILVILNGSYRNWNESNKIITADVNSYYAYLPMVFIYHDIDMKFTMDNKEKAIAHYWSIGTPIGKRAILTSMGMSYLYAPFFLAGHGIAQLTEYAGDEFSAPYKIALIISCLFYLTLGLVFLRKFLLRYFSDYITSLTLVIVLFGTNLLHYVTDEPTMTHAYSFSLVSVFLYLITQWFEKHNIKTTLLIGATAGLITLIRPSNILIVLLLIFWGVGSLKELGDRILFYFRNIHLVILMILAFILVWVPQFLYWYYISGVIFFNTYGTLDAGFFFNNPQIYHTLFSYRKGWLLYTPAMVFAITGIIILFKNKDRKSLAILIFLLFNIYVISSWWCWWYGGGFGMRPFVDSYAIMAIPLAAFLAWALKQRKILRYVLLLLIGFTFYLNIFQVTQYRRGFMHYVMMTKASYWENFHDMTPSQRYWDKLVFPDYNGARQGKYYTENEKTEIEKRLYSKTKKELIQETAENIRNSPAYMILMEEKALKWNMPVDSVIMRDAEWLVNKKLKDAANN